MLINDASFRDEVRRIVNGFTKNAVLQEDLQQEAMIHAWKIEMEKPDRTRSWYLQSCRFHLQHWLVLGRSVDSMKRATTDACVLIDELEFDECRACGECFESVSFHDLVATLSKRLRPAENGVLQGLANGMRLREVARNMGLSYPTALKYRRKIADLVSRLESLGGPGGTEFISNSGTVFERKARLGPQRRCPKAAPSRLAPRVNRLAPPSPEDDRKVPSVGPGALPSRRDRRDPVPAPIFA